MTSLRHNQTPDPGPTRDPRDLYLDAARACLLDVGWRRTTLTEVARRAGVSRMTIYRTWADMPRLLADLMTREWSGIVASAVADQDDTLPRVERLVSAITATVRALRANELFVRIVELDPELILPYLLSRRGRSQDLILDVVEREILAGQAAGEVRPGSPSSIARGVLLAAHGFVLSAHTMVDGQVSEQDVESELAHLLTRGLLP
ncbi:TetR/AcrR family transcriptional regulator [Nocardioides sp.]|jgi:AcrR family transcriptional regulator|uniref:TetR/AcrR family transcriptional regulator n=1 Tax=Nocardioides sp. TaxID=35761 RepID=UPI00262EDEA9|nr:TetR/AcrR family transcriptional regulator [Nocardioides sp.]